MLYKEPAVRVPTLSRLSAIAKSLGLEMEDNELMAYRGGNLSNELLYMINYTSGIIIWVQTKNHHVTFSNRD